MTQLDWTPPGQGNMQVVKALDQLAEKPLAEKIAAANKIALERIIQSHPVLVGYDQAINVVPGMTRTTILHAGPPVTWEKMCGAMKGAVTGALVFEGLATDWRTPQGWRRQATSPSHRATSTTVWALWRASPPRRCLCTSLRTKLTATAPSPTSASRWRRSAYGG
ncbi:hypothetical protein ACVXG7_14175 [Enterobacter hormaechei]